MLMIDDDMHVLATEPIQAMASVPHVTVILCGMYKSGHTRVCLVVQKC